MELVVFGHEVVSVQQSAALNCQNETARVSATSAYRSFLLWNCVDSAIADVWPPWIASLCEIIVA